MIINNSYLFEIGVGSAVGGNGREIAFPQNLGELNNAIVYGIEVYSGGDINAAPSGATPVPLSGCRSAALKMFDNSRAQLFLLPLIDLIPSQQGGLQRQFIPFPVNMSKSRLVLFSNTGISANQSFVLNFIFNLPK